MPGVPVRGKSNRADLARVTKGSRVADAEDIEAVLQMMRRLTVRDTAEQLTTVMVSRAEIEQAKGVSADEASSAS